MFLFYPLLLYVSFSCTSHYATWALVTQTLATTWVCLNHTTWVNYHLGTLFSHSGNYTIRYSGLKTVYDKLWTWDWTWNWKYNSIQKIGGGNRSVTWTFAEIRQYAADCHDFEDGHELKFMSNVHEDISVGENCVKTQIPIQKLTRLSRLNLLQICKVHKIQVNPRTGLSEILESIANHKPCDTCLCGYVIFTAFKKAKTNAERAKTSHAKKKLVQSKSAYEFPPQAPPHGQLEKIVNFFCLNMQPDSILEEGCAVCYDYDWYQRCRREENIYSDL